MDVRASLNADDNCSVITGDGEKSYVENDSFFARAPPQAASTVSRTKSRRYLQECEMGSFIEGMPSRATPVEDMSHQLHLSFSAADSGARPKFLQKDVFGSRSDGNVKTGDQPGVNGDDWSDGKSSLGIINVDDMDLSSNHLLLESPVDDMFRREGGQEMCLLDFQRNSHQSTLKDQHVSGDSNAWRSESNSHHSTLKDQISSDSNAWKSDGNLHQSASKEQVSADSNAWRSEGSSTNDSKPDQPFARSQIDTVKKFTTGPQRQDPVVTAIRQSLFGQTPIGEEEEGDTSVYNVELEAEDLQELDADFSEMNCSDDSDKEEATVKTPTKKTASTLSGEDFKLDSIYLRPGLTGEEQHTHNKLPYLSKVSLFDGGSGSEIDTEDELEQARKAQGTRHEAAGEVSLQDLSRPGLEGGCSDDTSNSCSRQLPITQRQSAEGDVVSSPVPGDGGGGGDGSSGSESDDGRRSNMTDHSRHSNAGYHGNIAAAHQSQARDQQEQRIRPMGDDLLSEMRYSSYNQSGRTNQDAEDTRLHSRYLAPNSPVDDTNPENFNTDDFLSSQHQQSTEQDFDPGNRLEASGFNADDLSALNDKGSNSNPFGVMASSFGSFGLSSSQADISSTPALGDESGPRPNVESGDSFNSFGMRRTDGHEAGDDIWAQLEGSTATSLGSKHSSLGAQSRTSPRQGTSPNHQEVLEYARHSREDRASGSLGKRSAASGSPSRRKSSPRPTVKDSPSSSISGYSSAGSDHAQSNHSSMTDLRENDVFKKPSMPAPKAANVSSFTKSVVKSKLPLSNSQSASGPRSGQSSGANSAKSSGSEYVDLAFKMSLTGKVEEQKQGLRRVPSVGGTTEMDLTIPDDDFFRNDDALAMLDADEEEFEHDNVIRQDDAMADTGSPNDSWAYRSIMSVARPSWMEEVQDEEKVLVRISVGSYMRGRTEALGSLDGDDNAVRPDFGMEVRTPPREKSRPARLIEESEEDVFEAERTSGVGQYGNGTPTRTKSEDKVDSTLTIDSLLQTPTNKTMGYSVLDLDTIGLKSGNNATSRLLEDSAKLSMGELSMFLKSKQQQDVKTRSQGLLKMRSHKCKSKHEEAPVSQPITSQNAVTDSNTTLHKSSQLPVRKGSNLNRSFPKVGDVESSLMKSDGLQKDTSNSRADSGFKGSSVAESLRESPRKKEVESAINNEVDKSMSPKASTQDEYGEDIWSSPNVSNYCGSTSGLLERLEDFKFSENLSSVKKDLGARLGEELRQNLKSQYSLSDTAGKTRALQQDMLREDREKTPPPDGEDRRTDARSKNNPSVPLSPSISRRPEDSLMGDRTKNDKSVNNTSEYKSGIGREFSKTDEFRHRSGKARELSKTTPSLQNNKNSDSEISRLNSSDMDHGYMPGHHIPDGTEYSERSDYSHMGHKGMSREDVAGVEDIGLAESRGFDVLRGPSGREKTKHENQGKFNGNAFENRSGVSTSDMNAQDRLLAMSVSGMNKHKGSLNLKPTQSQSPMSRNTSISHVPVTQTVTQTQAIGALDEQKNVETQTACHSKRLESWTQTSLVLNKSVGLQPDSDFSKNVNTDSNQNVLLRSECSNNQVQAKTMNVTSDSSKPNHSGIPPKLPVTSFKHNLLQNSKPTHSDKLHLLTKKSLLQTDFAQENLKRDYNIEVMDKIYSSDNVPESFFEMNSTVPNHESFRHHPPSAHSTPFPQSGDMFSQYLTSQFSQTSMSTPCYNQSQLSTGYLSVTEGNLAKNLPDQTPARASLCPVEAPGVLKFKDACCVGISRKEVMRLKNPTDRWMECIIQVKSLEVDGRSTQLESTPFEMRQRKVIIDPYKTEGIDVMFLPKFAGAYVAHVQVFSHSFLKKDDVNMDVIPVNVTFQAIAEEPWIKVTCDEKESSCIDFGEMVWGSCREKIICLRNMGHATVPLRLAITSNKAWHCFSFEPEGRMSDVSIISGQHKTSTGHGRSIINISLPGSTQPFNYHEVRVWCRPPDKQCNKAIARQPPEEFSCNVDVEVDIPYTKLPKLSSLFMKAQVGVQKLHIESNLQAIKLSAAPKKIQNTSVKIYNAGNLDLHISFGFSEHKDVYAVSPSSLSLHPGVDAELQVTFMPLDISRTRYEALLLMLIHPQGPMYELKVHGEVKMHGEGGKDRVASAPSILCDCVNLDFSGVALGKTVVKRYQLINKGDETVTMMADVRVDDVLLASSPDPNSVGSKKKELHLQPEEIVPVYVVYSPSTPTSVCGKIVMRPDNCSRKFTVRITGYGGVSKLSCLEEYTESRSVRGFPCIGIHNLTSERVKEVYIQNIGAKPANVIVTIFKDLNCKQRMLSGQIVVQPSKFTIDEHQRQKLEVVISMTNNEFMSLCEQHGVGGALSFSYHDQVESNKPHRSQLVVGLIQRMWSQLPNDSNMTLDMCATETFATPSVSKRSMPRTKQQPIHKHELQRGLNQLSNRSEDSSSSVNEKVDIDNTGGWNIRPQQLVLYCSSRGVSEELDKFHIYNNRNRDINFEIIWPGGMLSLTPDRGIVRARENKWIRIFPSTQATQSLDQLPWSGNVMVTCDGQMKTLKVQVRCDTSCDDNIPEPDDPSLVPISNNTQHHLTASPNKLGKLQVSHTVVTFPMTRAGKTSEESIVLTNVGNDMLRWMFSSFASPYLRKRADNAKEMFRVSYKVFDFSRQFGKLSGQNTVQLTLQFMPRSAGTFSQYWDLQTTGNSSHNASQRQDFIRIHLTGEGLDEADSGKSKSNSASMDDLMPRLSSDNYRLKLKQDLLQFPCVAASQCNTQKVELKNSHTEDVQVEVVAPKPPFYVRHPHFKIAKKRYLRLPIEFQPSRPGKYKDVVKFQGSMGETLVLQVFGECS